MYDRLGLCFKMINQSINVVGHNLQIPAAFRQAKEEFLHINDKQAGTCIG